MPLPVPAGRAGAELRGGGGGGGWREVGGRPGGRWVCPGFGTGQWGGWQGVMCHGTAPAARASPSFFWLFWGQSFAAPAPAPAGYPRAIFRACRVGDRAVPCLGGPNRKAPSRAPCPCPCHPPAKGTGTPPASHGAIRPRPRHPPGAPWHGDVRGAGLGCSGRGAKFGFGGLGGCVPLRQRPSPRGPAPGCL